MNPVQIRRFIDKITDGENINFYYYWSKRHRLYKFEAFAHYNGKSGIYINRDMWDSAGVDRQRMILAHEVGHFKTDYRYSHKTWLREYGAEVWAIQRLDDLGMTRISKMLKNQMNNWKTYDWNKWRKYRMAHNLAKKRGII